MNRMVIMLAVKNNRASRGLFLLMMICSCNVFAIPSESGSLSTEHFMIFFSPGTDTIAKHLQAQAEPALQYVSESIGIAPPGRIFVQIMPRDRKDRTRIDPKRDWVAGLAIPKKSLIIVMTHHLGTAHAKEIRTILLHEISHILVGSKNPEEDSTVCPRWFDEGIAMLIAHEWRVSDAIFLGKVIATDSQRPLREFASRFPMEEARARIAYLESASFVSYLNHRYGREAIRRIIREIGPGKSFHAIVREITGRGLADLEEDWLKRLRLKYKWVPLIFGSFSIWTLITVLFLLGYIRKRKRMQKIKAGWEEESGYHDPNGF